MYKRIPEYPSSKRPSRWRSNHSGSRRLGPEPQRVSPLQSIPSRKRASQISQRNQSWLSIYHVIYPSPCQSFAIFYAKLLSPLHLSRPPDKSKQSQGRCLVHHPKLPIEVHGPDLAGSFVYHRCIPLGETIAQWPAGALRAGSASRRPPRLHTYGRNPLWNKPWEPAPYAVLGLWPWPSPNDPSWPWH